MKSDSLNDQASQSFWHVYILECADKTLYTGVAKDISRRIKEHNEGHRGAKYTRVRRPVKLVYSERVINQSFALKREYEIKKLSRSEKIQLITENGFLNKEYS